MQVLDRLTTVGPLQTLSLCACSRKTSKNTITMPKPCLLPRIENNSTSRQLSLVSGLELRSPSMSSDRMRGRVGSSSTLSPRITQQWSSYSLLPPLTLLTRFVVTDQLESLLRIEFAYVTEISILPYLVPTIYPLSRADSTRRHGSTFQCQRIIIRAGTSFCSTGHH
jgi:hypothetical protein